MKENENLFMDGDETVSGKERKKESNTASVADCALSLHEVGSCSEELRFRTDFRTRFIVETYLKYIESSIASEDFFINVMHEHIRQRDAEMYAKLVEAAEAVEKTMLAKK